MQNIIEPADGGRVGSALTFGCVAPVTDAPLLGLSVNGSNIE